MVNDSLQSPPHEIPAGLEVMVPVPVPDLVMVRGWVEGVPAITFALTTLFPFITTVQVLLVPALAQSNSHGAIEPPAPGVVVSITLLF